MRVIILAPIGRDAALLAQTLTAADIAAVIAKDADELLSLLAEGAGGTIIADEALPPHSIKAVATWLAGLPPWSDRMGRLVGWPMASPFRMAWP